jgi:hypothetical protein
MEHVSARGWRLEAVGLWKRPPPLRPVGKPSPQWMGVCPWCAALPVHPKALQLAVRGEVVERSWCSPRRARAASQGLRYPTPQLLGCPHLPPPLGAPSPNGVRCGVWLLAATCGDGGCLCVCVQTFCTTTRRTFATWCVLLTLQPLSAVAVSGHVCVCVCVCVCVHVRVRVRVRLLVQFAFRLQGAPKSRALTADAAGLADLVGLRVS